jgi:hypothetical protein
MNNTSPQNDQTPQTEPSVLDYFKSLFRFGDEKIHLSEVEDQTSAVDNRSEEDQLPITNNEASFSNPTATPFPWRSLLALFFALIGQYTFEPPPTTSPLGIAFYFAAFGLLGWAIYRGDWTLESYKQSSTDGLPLEIDDNSPVLVRGIIFLSGILHVFIGFVLF